MWPEEEGRHYILSLFCPALSLQFGQKGSGGKPRDFAGRVLSDPSGLNVPFSSSVFHQQTFIE